MSIVLGMEPIQMSYAEIEARFPGEWVLVGDPSLDEVGNVLSGSILAHNIDRDLLYDEGVRLKPTM